MLALAVAAAVLSIPGVQDPSRLELGNPIEGRIEDTDPIVETEALRKYFTDAPVLGDSYAVVISEQGTHTIELRSYDFDAYLVLLDLSGKVLAEDDDGSIGTHSRIVFEATRERGSFLVEACALHGKRGRYELKLTRGKPEVLSAEERRRAAIEDARSGLRAVEAEKGPEHPDTATSLESLASLLQGIESYTEARKVFERALEIREKALGPDHPDTASTLNLLAWLLRAMGSYAEARPLFERALAIREKALGPDDPKTAASLDNLALLLQTMGNFAEARPLFERGLAIREATLGPDSPYTAWSLNNLAALLQTMGSYAEARPLYERALAIQEKALGPDHADIARSLNNLGSLSQTMGNYSEARPLYERAFAMRERVLGPEHSDTAMSLNCLASLLQSMGSYREARALYEHALAIHEKALGPEHPTTAISLNSLAWLLQIMGKYSEARPLFERALAIREKALGPDHSDTASSLNNLALLLETMGNPSEARPLLDRALAIEERTLGPEHPSTAIGLHNLAALLSSRGNYAEALPLLEHALAIREKTFGPDHPNTALGLGSVASVLQAMGRTSEARPLFERALAIREKTLGPEHPATAVSLNSLSNLLQSMGNSTEARSYCERALAIDEKALGPEHPETATILGNLAVLLADLGEGEAAWDLSSTAFERTIRSLRNTFPVLAEAERVSLCSSFFYRMESILALEPRSPDPSTRRTTYGSVLTWKGQVTRTSLEDRERTLRSLSPEKRTEVQDLRGVQSQISAELSKASAGKRESRETRLTELRNRRSMLERELLGASGSPDRVEPSPEDLIARLSKDAVLVDFIQHAEYVPAVIEKDKARAAGHWTDPHVTAWIVRGGSATIDRIDLGEAKPLREAILKLLSLLQGERGVATSPGAGGDGLKEANDRVLELLWRPVASRLAGATRVFVSPDRFLGTFPLGTLVDEDGRYLVEKLTISYVSDGATLAAILGSAPSPAKSTDDSLLDIGGIDYDARGKDEPAKPRDDLASGSSVRGSFQAYWEPLRFARKEAETVFALHESGRKKSKASTAPSAQGAAGDDGSRMILGPDAVEEVLKREVSGRRFIHIATHGFFQPEGLPSMWENARERAGQEASPMSGETERITGLLPGLLSGLVCAGANLPVEEGRDDGLLTAEEVTWLDLTRCDLLVLSACQTALGKDRAGEGMMSLQRAFQMAGAKSVVASLWNVDDERTVELMRSFYRGLWLDGQSRIDALRIAQIEMLAKNRAERQGRGLPWTWGAFVLYGDWR